jgi:Flp pilus assembly secretin CpaC
MRLSGSEYSMTTQRILSVLVLSCVCLALPGRAQAQSGAPYRGGQRSQSGIQLTQRVTADDTKPKKPLPYAIEEMPDIQEEMEIIHRRSQLIVARAPIARIAVADPSVVDIVQYSPSEIGIIGMSLGTTTLTMWFDNSRDPLIYLVEVIRDPTFEDRLRNDFGKLEKQLRILFPNSKVFLIPLQQRLIVKRPLGFFKLSAHRTTRRSELLVAWVAVLAVLAGAMAAMAAMASTTETTITITIQSWI